MKRIEQLTQKKIDRAKGRGRYPDGNGLFLKISETGGKSWVLRFERGGRERFMGLGSLNHVTLEAAREAAAAARKLLKDGIDPIEARRATQSAAHIALSIDAAKNITLRAAAQQYYDEHSGKWKNPKARAQFMSTLKAYVLDVPVDDKSLDRTLIGDLPVSAINTALVLRCLKPIWTTKRETADRVRGRLEAVLGWSIVHEYRAGDNPARWRGHLKEALPARNDIKRHHAAIAYNGLPAFMTVLQSREEIASKALQFTILAACRTNETIGARWPEIDLNTMTWTIPPERMKSKREHRVPLTDDTIKILKGLPSEKDNPFVFIGARKAGLSNMAMAQLLKRLKRDDITVHGMRSTFRTWISEETTYPHEIAEAALAHVISDKVVAAYQRGDLFNRRRDLMAEWSDFVAGRMSGKVIKLRRGQ